VTARAQDLPVTEPNVLGKRLSVIMPAFNEAEHIYENIRRVCTALPGSDWEVIVVDDGSSDETFRESDRSREAGFPVKTLRQELNAGKGAALFYGFGASTGEIIAFLDADLEIPPESVLQLLAQMDATGAEVAVGVKSLGSSAYPRPRRLLSGIYRRLVGFLFGLPLGDTQTGVKVFRREVLERAIPRLAVKRFAFDLELLVAASRLGYHIVECPVPMAYRREGGLGRIRPLQMAGMFADTLVIYYRSSFWRWLEPGAGTKMWMALFAAGLLIFGIGVGKVLTPIVLQPPVSNIVYVVALQFLPRALRDWLLVLGGIVLLTLAFIQLNKSLLNAFARRDRGDLAGIFNQKD